MPDLVRHKLDTLVRDGITPTPDEIIELYEIGRQIETPELMRHMSRGTPVKVGGAVLWQQTIASANWMERVGNRYSEPGHALAFSMAHAYDKNLQLMGPDDVDAWCATVTATDGELNVAMAEIIVQSEEPEMPPRKTPNNSTEIDLVSACMQQFGGTPAQWEAEISVPYMSQLLAAISGHNAETGTPNDADPRRRAEIAFAWAGQKIRRRHAKEQEGAPHG